MDRYVVGYAFTPDMLNVALIQKKRVRPGFEWMKGKLNGLGGKILPGEEAREAMSREFLEEAGVHIIPESWTLCGSFYKRREYEVFVFRSLSLGVLNVRTASPEEGKVSLCRVSYVLTPLVATVPALDWLLPLITYPQLRVFRVAEQ